jgi:hypothetical protein
LVASDGTNVYYVDQGGSAIRYCPRAAGCGTGGKPLATGETSVASLALDAVSVIWARADGVIRRVAKP